MPFQYAFDLSGTNSQVPIAVNRPVSGTAGYNLGDLLILDTTTGQFGTVTSSVGTASAVMAGTRSSGTAGQLMPVYIVRPNQVWRCSMNAATSTGTIGVRNLTCVNAGTLNATPGGGSIALYDKSDLDAAGNISALVTFPFTTW